MRINRHLFPQQLSKPYFLLHQGAAVGGVAPTSFQSLASPSFNSHPKKNLPELHPTYAGEPGPKSQGAELGLSLKEPIRKEPAESPVGSEV